MSTQLFVIVKIVSHVITEELVEIIASHLQTKPVRTKM